METATARPAANVGAAIAINHKDMANAIRALAMDAVEKANSGHPGMPMGMADVATVLFSQFLKFDPQHPDWPDRDRKGFLDGCAEPRGCLDADGSIRRGCENLRRRP